MNSSKHRPAGFHIQERDLSLLRGLFECRVMNAKHIAVLYFEGRAEYAKKRIQQLKAKGYVRARLRLPSAPAVLYLGREGLRLLQDSGALADYPPFSRPALERRANVSASTISHELAVMDVKTAFHRAVNSSCGLSNAEFSTWPLLNEFESVGPTGQSTKVQPDGFIRFYEKRPDSSVSEHAFFMEVDRSTETLDILISKARSYIDYYKSGGFAARSGAQPSVYKDFPFRLLIILESEERRNNVAERLLRQRPPILTQVWLSTQVEAARDPFGAIWIRPFDYRTATEGTPFDAAIQREYAGYRRNTRREAFVEEAVQKSRLLGSA